jgi:hypothetical protein
MCAKFLVDKMYLYIGDILICKLERGRHTTEKCSSNNNNNNNNIFELMSSR